MGSHNEYVVEVLRDKVEEFIFVLDDFKTMAGNIGRPHPVFMQMVRIAYKLVKGLVETLLRKGKLSYRTLEDGRAREEEYYRFLTKEETDYFLASPR